MDYRAGKLDCPSAHPAAVGVKVFGVVLGGRGERRVSYLDRQVDLTEELSAAASGVELTRIFRFSGKCIESKCKQFDGERCGLGDKISSTITKVTKSLPRCTIRATCRWFSENGRESCFRCPSIVTAVTDPTDPVVSLLEAQLRRSACE